MQLIYRDSDVDTVLIELSDTCQKIIKNDIPDDIFIDDMKRRAHYIWDHKRERCLEQLLAEWIPKLAAENATLPSDKIALAEMAFSHPDYKCRKTREDEAAAKAIADQEAAEAAALAEMKAQSDIEKARRQKELADEEATLQVMIAQAVQDALTQNLTNP